MRPQPRCPVAIEHKQLQSGPRKVEYYKTEEEVRIGMLGKDPTKAPAITLCPPDIHKPILARVTYVQVRVKSAADSMTHQSQQKIGVFSASIFCAGSRTNGFIKAQRHRLRGTAHKEAASA